MLQKRGEELSTARVNSKLHLLQIFTKGIDTIRSNQASKQFSSHVLDEIKNTEKNNTDILRVIIWSCLDGASERELA